MPDCARDLAIPEPATYALFLVAIALFLLFRWRKQFNPRNVPVKQTDLFNTK